MLSWGFRSEREHTLSFSAPVMTLRYNWCKADEHTRKEPVEDIIWQTRNSLIFSSKGWKCGTGGARYINNSLILIFKELTYTTPNSEEPISVPLISEEPILAM